MVFTYTISDSHKKRLYVRLCAISLLTPLPLYRYTQTVAQQQQVEQLPRREGQEQPVARVASDMDAELFKQMKAEAALRGYLGYGKFIEDAVRAFIAARA